MSKKQGECKLCKKCFLFNEKQQNGKWCSNKCQMQYQYENYIEKWKHGLECGGNGCEISAHVRKYLHELNQSKCALCGWGERNKFTGKVPLQIHHIDGNSTNHSKDNIILLCPNCHCLTENYGSKNKLGRYKRINKNHPKYS